MVNEGPIESSMDRRRPPKPKSTQPLLQYLSISTMTYSKPKTKALKNSKSLAYKANKIINSNPLQLIKSQNFKKRMMLKRYITYFKN